MLFNSYLFMLVFFPVVLIGWWRLPSERLRLGFLTLASWVFYSAWQFPKGLEVLPLLLASTTADYMAGRRMTATDDQRIRRRWLVMALTVNIGLLATFKYLGMFEQMWNAAAGLVLGPGSQVPVHELILPLGISFYTFNSMSYSIDIYRRRVEPAKNFLHYCCFVALFPHLVAGPIVRYSDIDEQLRNLRSRLTSRMVAVGMFFIICGLFKKVVLSDPLSSPIDELYGSHDELGAIGAWASAIGYFLRLYFDYSGYADIAVGTALLLGFRFPQAFNSPFKATDISDFWKRWNMTLTRWVIDYVFIPLGGSRGSRLRMVRNVMIISLLMGLWHGAQFTYVLAGLLFGCATVTSRLAKSAGLRIGSRRVAQALTFITVTSLFSIFRSPDVTVAFDMLAAMYGANGLGSISFGATAGSLPGIQFLLQLGAALLLVFLAPNTWQVAGGWTLPDRLVSSRLAAWGLGAAGGIGFLLLGQPSPFLYFQF